MMTKHRNPLMARLIPQVVADHYGVPVEALWSKMRTRAVSEPRRLAAWLLKQRTILTLQDIGDILDRDHTTIIYALRMVKAEMQRNPCFARTVDEVQILVTKASLVSAHDEDGVCGD